MSHLLKKRRNLVISTILLVLQLFILGVSLYLMQGETTIYGNIAVIFFIIGIPNLAFITTNIVMLIRGEWINLRFALDKISFVDHPQKFLEYTFPTTPIVLILLPCFLSLYLLLSN